MASSRFLIQATVSAFAEAGHELGQGGHWNPPSAAEGDVSLRDLDALDSPADHEPGLGTDVFLWTADRIKGPDVQFNHVWTCAGDPNAYTALWHLCCTPAFLAKATDTHPIVAALLQYRAWDLYGHHPAGSPLPAKPAGYDRLAWASMPAPVSDLEALSPGAHGVGAWEACGHRRSHPGVGVLRRA